MSEKEKRGMLIHFIDGTKKLLEFPPQYTEGDAMAAAKIKEALDARHMVVEADGAMIVIPFESIKYVQIYPSPKKLPAYAIKGASFKD